MQHVTEADGTTVFRLDPYLRTNIIHINRQAYKSTDSLGNAELSDFNCNGVGINLSVS